MDIEVGGKRQTLREIDTTTLFGYIQRSGVSMSYTTGSKGGYTVYSQVVGEMRGQEETHTTYLIDKWWKKNEKMKYGNMKLLDNLGEEMGRTRRLERSINEHIPNRLEKHYKKRDSLNKKSPQYNRSLKCIGRKIDDEQLKLKEYKFELKYRKRLVYTCSKYLVPAIYILRREKYNRVIAKWRFMGKTQKPIHLGTMKDVAHLSDDELKRRAIQRIRKRFNEPLDTLTLKWIKDENKKINDWCEKMGYSVQRD